MTLTTRNDAINEGRNFVADDHGNEDRTHFLVRTSDGMLLTVSVTGSRPAVGPDRSRAEANFDLKFRNAEAGLNFKEAVQMATSDDLRMLRWPIGSLPGQKDMGATTTFGTDLLT